MRQYLVIPFVLFFLAGGNNLSSENNYRRTLKIYNRDDRYLFLESGFYKMAKNKKYKPEDYATVERANNTLKFVFKMYWSGWTPYKVYQINGNILKARFRIYKNEYDTLTINILSQKTFKVIDGTYNWGVDFPYFYNEVYSKVK